MLPSPDGLSGSFLWDTKYVACGGQNWDPTLAKVAGVIIGYEDARLIAVKVELARGAG